MHIHECAWVHVYRCVCPPSTGTRAQGACSDPGALQEPPDPSGHPQKSPLKPPLPDTAPRAASPGALRIHTLSGKNHRAFLLSPEPLNKTPLPLAGDRRGAPPAAPLSRLFPPKRRCRGRAAPALPAAPRRCSAPNGHRVALAATTAPLPGTAHLICIRVADWPAHPPASLLTAAGSPANSSPRAAPLAGAGVSIRVHLHTGRAAPGAGCGAGPPWERGRARSHGAGRRGAARRVPGRSVPAAGTARR